MELLAESELVFHPSVIDSAQNHESSRGFDLNGDNNRMSKTIFAPEKMNEGGKAESAKELWTGSTQELASSTIQRSSLAFDARLLNEGREPLINDGISMKVYASYATNCEAPCNVPCKTVR